MVKPAGKKATREKTDRVSRPLNPDRPRELGSLDAAAGIEGGARRASVFRVFGLQRAAQRDPAGFFTHVCDITQDMAGTLLELQEEAEAAAAHMIQRRRIQSVIERYARDMVAGYWGEGGAPFEWDIYGRCRNGQQRLNACVRSGVTLKNMLIVLDAKPDAILNIDQDKSRSQLDTLWISGRQAQATKQHKSVVQLMEGINGKQPSGSYKASVLELDERLIQFWPAVHFAVQSCEGRRVAGLSVAPILGAVAKAYYHEDDKERLGRFMPLLLGLAQPDSAADRTVINFAGHVQRLDTPHSGQERQWLHLKAQHAVYCYMRGEVRLHFRMMRTENYPLPG